jgi:PmbA protein
VSTSNLYMQPGRTSAAGLMADLADGVYVTELIGQGVNGVTGDYSRGAAGFRIRDGQLAEPVAEFTIAGNLKDMFLALTPANDLEFRYGVNVPTLRIDGMTVAGG